MFRYQGPEREKTIRVIRPQSFSHKKDETLNYLSRQWLPSNPSIVGTIAKNIENGVFLSDRAALVDEVKKDPATFFNTSRNLRPEVADAARGIDPLKQLLTLEDEKLKKLFEVNQHTKGVHQLKLSTNLQAKVLKHCLTCAHTADGIAQVLELSGDQAYSAALFRQLGTLLLAWNYPRIYQRILGDLKNGSKDIETATRKFFEFSPLELGRRFSSDWEMAPALKSLQQRENSLDQVAILNSSDKINLETAINLGELYAQSRDPETFPSAHAKWKQRAVEISDFLPQNIFSRAEEKIERIISTIEELRQHSRTPRATPIEAPATKVELLKSNPFVYRCSDEVRSHFEMVYSHIVPDKLSLDAIRLVSDHLVQILGFDQGCLFFANKETLQLSAALRFGEVPLKSYNSYINGLGKGLENFTMRYAPFKCEGLGVLGQTTTQIYSSINHPQLEGLLYMELSEGGSSNNQENAIIYYQALRQTLVDCLGMER